MSKIVYLTEEGYNKLKSELTHLRSIERPSISQQIAEARDKGDLSENAEYDAAKEAQGLLEMRIGRLEATFAIARILDQSKINTDNVKILNKVRILNKKSNKEFLYTIVNENEANVKEGKLSVDTPIAKALLGKVIGDVVEVKVPSGSMTFEILEISI